MRMQRLLGHRDPLERRRVRPEQRPAPSAAARARRRCLTQMPRWKSICVRGSPTRRHREAVRAALDRARQLRWRPRRTAGASAPAASSERAAARARQARRRARRRARRPRQHRRRGDRQQRQRRAARRGGGRGRARGRRRSRPPPRVKSLQQRVEEDDALGRPEAGDVGVGRRRALGRVHDQHAVDRHAGARRRARSTRAAQLRLGGLEPVEERVDQRRARRAATSTPTPTSAAGARQPPAVAVAAHARRPRAQPPAGRQRRRDRLRLDAGRPPSRRQHWVTSPTRIDRAARDRRQRQPERATSRRPARRDDGRMRRAAGAARARRGPPRRAPSTPARGPLAAPEAPCARRARPR